jgi:hypothetical protein
VYGKSIHTMQRHIALQGQPINKSNNRQTTAKKSPVKTHTSVLTIKPAAATATGHEPAKHNTICPVHKMNLLTPAQASMPWWLSTSVLSDYKKL